MDISMIADFKGFTNTNADLTNITLHMENMQISRESSVPDMYYEDYRSDANEDNNSGNGNAGYYGDEYDYDDDDNGKLRVDDDDDFDIGGTEEPPKDRMAQVLSSALADMSKKTVSDILARVIASMPEDSTSYMIADEFIKILNEMELEE